MTKALYQRVINDLLDKVDAGDLNVGDRLPPEAVFAEQLGVSRSTLRLAFAELEKRGILQRRKRGGTQIIADRPKTQFSMITNGIRDVLSLGRDTRLTVTGKRYVSKADVAALLEVSGSEDQWLEITGTRTLDQQEIPFNWSCVYVPMRFSSIESQLGASVTSVFQLLEQHYSVTVARVTQNVSALACPIEAANCIGLEKGAAALRIEAQLLDENDTVLAVSDAIFDPGRFQVSTDVRTV